MTQQQHSHATSLDDEIWSELRYAQGILIDMGYTFDVSERHHTVYRDEVPLFGLCRATDADRNKAMLDHWSAAIACALAHARIYRGLQISATPTME